MIKKIDQLIREHPFFAGLPADQIDLISGCGKNVIFQENEIIAREGDPADLFYVIRSGRVALEIHVPGKGALTVQTLEDGDVLGWSWLFPPYKWAFDSKALRETHAVALDGKCLRGKCDDDPGMGYGLMKRFAGVMTARLQAARLQMLDVYGTFKEG